ncbi:MAG: Omp28-related outer membrane protein [Bacteroidota bacterium]|nr:Omp28-related outer membrane protein [Bacteroidota bacterium]
MKKITLILSAAALVCTMGLTSCKKKTTVETPGCMDPNAFNYNKDAKKDDGTCQLPQTDRKATVYDVTGLWCPPCGEYGLPTFDKLSIDSKASVVPFSCHATDELTSTAGTAIMTTIMPGTAVPRMGVGTTLVFPAGVTTDITYNVKTMNTKINSITINDLIVGTGIKKSISGNIMSITTNSKFVVAASGVEYYMAVFILENGLVADQKTQTKGTVSKIHNHVVRHCFTTSVTGELLASGTIDAGKLISKTFTKTIPAVWNAANLSVATVIYYKDQNGKMQFENANIAE